MDRQEPPDVGSRVRALRQQRGLSQRALAGLCDLSPNAISLIERGAASPSVSTLHRLALALRVPITSFFEEGAQRVELLLSRPGHRSRTGTAGVVLESLGSGLEGQTLEAFVVTLQPGAGSGGPDMVHKGHELVYSLQGSVDYKVEGQPYRLAPGDALLFKAHLSHTWQNTGQAPAVFLLILQSDVAGDSVEQHLPA